MLSSGLCYVFVKLTSLLFHSRAARTLVPVLFGVFKVLLVVGRFEKVTLNDTNDADSSPQAGTLPDMETRDVLAEGQHRL